MSKAYRLLVVQFVILMSFVIQVMASESQRADAIKAVGQISQLMSRAKSSLTCSEAKALYSQFRKEIENVDSRAYCIRSVAVIKGLLLGSRYYPYGKQPSAAEAPRIVKLCVSDKMLDQSMVSASDADVRKEWEQIELTSQHAYDVLYAKEYILNSMVQKEVKTFNIQPGGGPAADGSKYVSTCNVSE